MGYNYIKIQSRTVYNDSPSQITVVAPCMPLDDARVLNYVNEIIQWITFKSAGDSVPNNHGFNIPVMETLVPSAFTDPYSVPTIHVSAIYKMIDVSVTVPTSKICTVELNTSRNTDTGFETLGEQLKQELTHLTEYPQYFYLSSATVTFTNSVQLLN